MRITTPLALVAASLILAVGAAAGPPAAALTITPVTDRDYRERVLAPRAGQVVLVSFWASWCAPCLEELPGMIKLDGKLAKHGADIVFVNTDPPGSDARVRAVLDKRGIALGDTFAVANEDPQPFLGVVDPGWVGQVPYQVLYGRDGARRIGIAGARPLAEIEQVVVTELGRGAPGAGKPR